MTVTEDTRRAQHGRIKKKKQRDQHLVLLAIKEYIKTRLKYPNYRDIARFMNRDTQSIQPRISELENELGLITSIKVNGERMSRKLITAKGNHYIKKLKAYNKLNK